MLAYVASRLAQTVLSFTGVTVAFDRNLIPADRRGCYWRVGRRQETVAGIRSQLRLGKTSAHY